MILIAAMSADGVIGSGNAMPWTIPEEYEQFREFIRGHAVLIGRKSFAIFGPDLTSDNVVVLSRHPDPIAGATVARNLQQGLDLAMAFGKPIYCCGGSEVYRQCLPLASEMLLSTIKGDYDGDAYFPKFDPRAWRLAEERDEPRYVFRRWVR